MKQEFDEEKIKYHVRGLLEAIGEDPDREGLVDTPQRVAQMYKEIFCGIRYSNEEIAEMFNKTFDDDLDFSSSEDMVVVKDIDIFSYCEHHIALMYDMKVTVAYIPDKKVIGLSKIVRIADMVSRRLQLQERIGSDIAEVMKLITGTEDVAVIIEGYHGCMTSRGIRKSSAKTVTQTLRGRFLREPNLTLRIQGY